ncbi:MAG: hypothetical protein OEW67_00230 [Cyclobacteriaceae bacterium]|nr:hypothetical protein [Cyclobacteriaceae bacterium]
MKKSKIIFLIAAGVFLSVMFFLGYDISSRTTWPWLKPRSNEHDVTREVNTDTVMVDSIIIAK